MKLIKVGIIVNPVGGSSRKGVVAQVQRAFEAKGAQVVIYHTTPEPGSATQLARQAAADGCTLVVAIGGDGTVCGVAEGLMGSETPMAVFPGGTGNLFARSYYAVPKPEKFVDMVLSGEPQPIDMVGLDYVDIHGKAHNQVFIVAMGLGKVSDAVGEASPVYKRIFGKLVYVVRVMLAALNPNARRFEFQTRGAEKAEQAAAVFVLNVAPPVMATLSRGCTASDGMLDVVVFGGTNFWHLTNIAASLAFGRPEGSSHYRSLRTREITIRSDEPVTPNVDGDQGAPTKELTVRSLPGAVKMVLAR